MSEITVAKGQTLWSYAKMLLGPGASKKEISQMTDKIANDNNIKNKNSIFAGQTLKVTNSCEIPLGNDIPDP